MSVFLPMKLFRYFVCNTVFLELGNSHHSVIDAGQRQAKVKLSNKGHIFSHSRAQRKLSTLSLLNFCYRLTVRYFL